MSEISPVLASPRWIHGRLPNVAARPECSSSAPAAIYYAESAGIGCADDHSPGGFGRAEWGGWLKFGHSPGYDSRNSGARGPRAGPDDPDRRRGAAQPRHGDPAEPRPVPDAGDARPRP